MHVQHGIVLTELLDLASLTTFRQRTLVQGLLEGSHYSYCTDQLVETVDPFGHVELVCP